MSLHLSVKFPPGSAALQSTLEIPLTAIGAATPNPVINADIVALFATKTLARAIATHRVHPHAITDAPATRDINAAQGQQVKGRMLYTNPVGDDPSHSDTIQVGVKTLTGKTMTLDILPVATVHELMLTIQNSEGIPADQQRLIFRGKSLHYRRNLADYGVVAGSELHLVLRLRGS